MPNIKNTTIKGYEFCTPKFGGEIQFEKVYDHELIDTLFDSILQLDKKIRKYKNDTVSFNLGNYQQSEDANIAEGYFITARHGVRRPEIDINTQEEVGILEKTQGVENNVYFMLDKRTGLLLVQDDFNKVFNRKLLHTFLSYHKNIVYPYIDEFNRINKKTPLKIHKRSCFRLLTLPPVNFMEKLKEFTEIKSAILTLDSTTEKKKVDVSEILDKELEDNEINKYDLEIKIKNKSGKAMVKIFERYFEKIMDLQKYDSYAIEGKLLNGKIKRISPDTITRDFYTDVEYNDNGEALMSSIYNQMADIILHDNPINGKGMTPNIKMVGENNNVDMAIQKEISVRNQDRPDQQEIS
ncbi:hypothetical protein OYT88_11820 [Sporolactobacillus sp. CQH2019]|uniref:hypothetical protein n=1 Tax=Sporolactobacillus sp. CQH2019 TaxID=3023512 RepID=UPI0023681A98|nr:hypothetical protein [Sporolactobacillus sp. CQH2019]MDD9149241.1 hypothetical protein [Sporolactobacillus sp. CQH2019]